jgi:Cache domain
LVSSHSAPPSGSSLRGWVIGIGVFAVLPMVVFSLLVGSSLLAQQRAALEAELQQQADFAARELAREVRVIFATLDSLATSDLALRGEYEALHAHARRVTAISPRIGAITAVDSEGVRRFSTLTPFTVTLPPTSLGEFDKLVLTTGKRQISPLADGSISGKKLVSFAVPVKDGDKFVMILRATMWTEAISEVVHEQPTPTNWSVAVVDQNMIQIARSRDPAGLIGKPASEVTQAAIRAGKKTPYAAVSREGMAMTASVAAVAGTGWTVVIAAPSTSLESEVWQALRSTLWIGALCAALSALGTWFLARVLRKQIQRATASSVSGSTTQQQAPTKPDS